MGIGKRGKIWAALGIAGLLLGGVAWSARIDATSKGQAPNSQQVSNMTTSTAPGPERTEGTWHTSYAAARAEAVQTDKPILLRFTATWCPPCQVMDANVWPDARVKAAVAQHVVPAKIDIDEPASADVARRYGIRTIPTLLVVDANGDELARGGFMSAEALVKFLQK